MFVLHTHADTHPRPNITTTRIHITHIVHSAVRISTILPHPFNGAWSGIIRVSRYHKGKTNLDFTEAKDSEWQWHQLDHMQVCTSLQTDNHASTPPRSFLQARCPSCRPTNSVKALKGHRRDLHIDEVFYERRDGSGSRRDVRNDRMPAVKWSGWRCNELVVASPGRRRQHVHVTAARSPGSHDTGRHTHTHTHTHPSRNITARALCTPTVISSSMLIAQLHQTRPDQTRPDSPPTRSGRVRPV